MFERNHTPSGGLLTEANEGLHLELVPKPHGSGTLSPTSSKNGRIAFKSETKFAIKVSENRPLGHRLTEGGRARHGSGRASRPRAQSAGSRWLGAVPVRATPIGRLV